MIYNSSELKKIILDWWVQKRFTLKEHLEWKNLKNNSKKMDSVYSIKRDRLTKKLIPMKNLLWNNESINLIIEEYASERN